MTSRLAVAALSLVAVTLVSVAAHYFSARADGPPETGWTEELVRARAGDGFRIVSADPAFIVASDLPAESLAAVVNQTIESCAEALASEFFDVRLTRKTVVYRLDGRESYEAFCKRVAGMAPHTPFGFYRSGTDEMFMNIATGGGTLVHEMTHALLRPDWATKGDGSDVPAWFNEGFASLFEQCATRDGKLRGLPNWRLRLFRGEKGVDAAIPLAKLVASSTDEFYEKLNGAGYATARYLCLYLQEQGFLARYYKEFRDGRKDDPTGKSTLESVTGKPLAKLEADWKAWLKDLLERETEF